jgi:hypothetical protein
MGNIQGLPKCPRPFESIGNLACLMPCPTERGYERRSANGGFQCVYKADPQYSTPLNTVAAAVFLGNTLDDLQKADINAYGGFIKERDRFVNEMTILDGKIDKSSKLKNAFQRLQDAENVRDKAPDAYQQARSMYYTLLKGDTWQEEERQRVLKAEVEPVANKFLEEKNTAFRHFENQRKTVDVVDGLKDKVLSLRDEVKYAANTFKEQVDKVQDAINRERRDRVTDPKVSFWDWLDTILNIIIVGSLLYVIYLLYKKFTRPAAPAVNNGARTLG